MVVLEFHCGPCGDTWHVPSPRKPRANCRECGSPLDVDSIEEVAV